MLASYLGVGGCREEKCVSLVPRCGWVSGGEMCYLVPTCRSVLVGLERNVSLVPTCRWMLGGMCQPRTYM